MENREADEGNDESDGILVQGNHLCSIKSCHRHKEPFLTAELLVMHYDLEHSQRKRKRGPLRPLMDYSLPEIVGMIE
jgi:hypothetical protein